MFVCTFVASRAHNNKECPNSVLLRKLVVAMFVLDNTGRYYYSARAHAVCMPVFRQRRQQDHERRRTRVPTPCNRLSIHPSVRRGMVCTSQFEFALSDREPEISSALSSIVVRFLPWTREKAVILNRSSCRSSRRFEL